MLDGCRLIWSLLIGLFRSRATSEAETWSCGKWKSRPRRGRPKVPLEIRQLICEISLAKWIARQLMEACGWDKAPRYLVHDRDRSYGEVFLRRVRAMGIRDRPTSPRSPWQNGYAERLSVRSDGSALIMLSCLANGTSVTCCSHTCNTTMGRARTYP